MKDFKYHLMVRNCRAIKAADIDLSEITVLAGVNASGKSTIARMFRDLVELSAEYERLLAVQMWRVRLDIWRYAILGRAHLRAGNFPSPQKLSIVKALANGDYTFADAIGILDEALQQLLLEGPGREKSYVVQRLRRMLDLKVEDGEELLDVFRTEAANTLAKFEKRKTNRSYLAYQELLQGNPLMEGQITLEEGAQTVFSNDNARDTLEEISFIKRAIYIESPFKSIPNVISRTEINMGDEFTRVKEERGHTQVGSLSELTDVLAGDVSFVKDFDEDESDEVRALLGHNGRWQYRRKDGKNFALDDCATGIRALSILNILHSYGWLDAETLLVIDEPEAHLHPQWVVEYARLLLLLSKRFKVRIVITTHSPDMVNAIHTIGMALGMGNDIGFYLAEGDDAEPYKYNYQALGNKVGDIFKAYNVSFDRIDGYAKNGLFK